MNILTIFRFAGGAVVSATELYARDTLCGRTMRYFCNRLIIQLWWTYIQLFVTLFCLFFKYMYQKVNTFTPVVITIVRDLLKIAESSCLLENVGPQISKAQKNRHPVKLTPLDFATNKIASNVFQIFNFQVFDFSQIIRYCHITFLVLLMLFAC